MTAQWAVRAATGLRPQAKSSPVDRTKEMGHPNGCSISLVWIVRDLNRAGVNGAPVEPQSRDRASPAGEVKSRRPHQRNGAPEWVLHFFGIRTKDLNRAEVNGAPVEPRSRDRASPAGEVKSR